MNEITAKVEFEKIKINELQAKINELEKIYTINKNSNSQVSELINKTTELLDNAINISTSIKDLAGQLTKDNIFDENRVAKRYQLKQQVLNNNNSVITIKRNLDEIIKTINSNKENYLNSINDLIEIYHEFLLTL
jgi:hypothetical protein